MPAARSVFTLNGMTTVSTRVMSKVPLNEHFTRYLLSSPWPREKQVGGGKALFVVTAATPGTKPTGNASTKLTLTMSDGPLFLTVIVNWYGAPKESTLVPAITDGVPVL